MNFKKGLLVFVLAFIVSMAVFSQAEEKKSFASSSIGITGSYGLFKPSIWSVGVMTESAGLRFGVTAGGATVTYERENPYSSTEKLTEYWQKSLYFDIIAGYVYQLGVIDILALRFGGDIIFSLSPAYQNQHRVYGNSDLELFNWAFAAIVGVKLFPLGKYNVSIDVCPGYATLISAMGKGAFVMPIRIGTGINF